MAHRISIEAFVAELRSFPESGFETTGSILRFLERNPVAPETLDAYIKWDRQHYTRNLIDKTLLYELIAICWEVGQSSSYRQIAGGKLPSGFARARSGRLPTAELEYDRDEPSATERG